MATKAELHTKLEAYYQAYLGFPCLAQKSGTKTMLEQRVGAIRRAIAWKRYANKLKAQIEAKYGPAWWMMPEARKEGEKMGNAYRKANDYWFKS